MGRLIVFAPFLLLLPLFLSAQILSGGDLGYHLTDCSEIWGHGRYGCEVVQQGFKMMESKADPRACPKLPKFCPDYFSLTTEGIVLNFFWYDRYWYIILQDSLNLKSQSQGLTLRHAQAQPILKVLNISETIQIPIPKPYILKFYVSYDKKHSVTLMWKSPVARPGMPHPFTS